MDHYRRSTLNYFSAGGLDRATLLRPRDTWLRERLTDPATRIVPVWKSRNLLAGDAVPLPAILLGTREHTVYFALELADDEGVAARLIPPGASFRELRDVGPLLDADAGSLLAYARAITYWHARHRHCGSCGAATRVAEAGHMRLCSDPACAQRHFPRTDPAVIVLVLHPGASGSEERCLLGHQRGWPETLYSAVAGFVEPGESLEDAVVREVAEETGVAVTAVHYHSSQPWPFPSSIMLGFTATAADDVIIRHDDELTDARWFSRRGIVDALRERRLRVPRRVSIAYRLLEDWFDAGELGALAGHLLE